MRVLYYYLMYYILYTSYELLAVFLMFLRESQKMISVLFILND